MAGNQIPITGTIRMDIPEDERRRKLKLFYGTISASKASRHREDESVCDASEGFTVAEGEAAAAQLGLCFRYNSPAPATYALVQPLPAGPARAGDDLRLEALIGFFTVEDQHSLRREEQVARPEEETRRLLA